MMLAYDVEVAHIIPNVIPCNTSMGASRRLDPASSYFRQSVAMIQSIQKAPIVLRSRER